MLAIVYIIVCLGVGFVLTENILKSIKTSKLITFKGNQTEVSSLFLRFPIWYAAGTLIVTWSVYLLACLFRENENPLLIANAIVIPLFFLAASVLIFLKRKGKLTEIKQVLKSIKVSEIIAFIFITAVFLYLFYHTLYVKNDELNVGLSVFSDFSPHLSMIRSFSHNGNFTTQYSFYAGQDVKYHFMFQFLCGNLEFLGMRIDHAFNIPSYMSILCTYMSLYALAIMLSGKRAVGILSMALLTFRSSFTFFIYAASFRKGDVVEGLKLNDGFIGSTNHEDWGLWNLNVYCNQRHLAFCLNIAIIVIILLMPALFSGFNRLKTLKKNELYESLTKLEGWKPVDVSTSIFAGVLLGLSGFWNGAVFLAVIMVLFFMAVVSDRRLEYVIVAGIGGFLSILQSSCFVDGSVFSTEFFYGFLSDNGTFFSSVEYIVKLMGVLPLLLLVLFILSKGSFKYIMFCFSVPIIFAFTISLTPDIAVNHKYIMFAIMLLDIPAAIFLVNIFKEKSLWIKGFAVALVATMTITGIYEFEIMVKMNNDERSFKYSMDDKLCEWVWENAGHDDIFLTSNYYLSGPGTGSSLILSGAMLYNGWQYFSWSAGYDTAYRDEVARNIYSAYNIDSLIKEVNDAGIRYIVVDFNNRVSEDYELNENIFKFVYEEVYTSGEGEWKTSIYDTTKLNIVK